MWYRLGASIGLTNKIGVRLVIATLLIGSVLSILSTGAQLGASYMRQRADATQVLDRLESTIQNALEQAIWTLDYAQVEIILDGLEADQNISYVSLEATTGESWVRGETPGPTAASDPVQRYELAHRKNGAEVQTVGALDVHLSLDAVRARVWAEFWTTFLTNLAKAYLAALALLFLVHRLIFRHLQQIAGYVEQADGRAGGMLALDRPPSRVPDDLDHIVGAIARYEARTEQQMEALAEEARIRQKAEEDAREALSIRTSFLGTISHEIRTPLNAIMGFLHLIENYKGIQDKPKLYAETATKASHQLLTLLNNTIDISRLEANAVDVEVAETDIRALAEDWRRHADGIRHMRKKDIHIGLKLSPDVPELVIIDAAHVTQIMTNLIDNAVKFTDVGTVEIGIACVRTETGQDLEISVSDTGVGIPEEARAVIFDRFTQADGSILREHGGSGLGLSICQELAKRMNAELVLKASGGDGFTTTFLLRFSDVALVDPAHDVHAQGFAH